jgi:D-3-phosphoglycerate dehydrogenase
MWKVMIAESVHEEGARILEAAPDVELILRPKISRTALLEEIGGMDAVITRSGTTIDREFLEKAPRLKVAARAGVGVDNIDLAEASRRGVVVINAPTGNTLAATEHTMALMLSMARRLPQAHASVTSGAWERKSFMGFQLHGRKLLIVGLGRIGTQVAIRAKVFGMEVSAYDPYVSAQRMETLGVRRFEDLRQAVGCADIVTLHVPATAETRGMIGREELEAFRTGACLINCARGTLVDEGACAAALRCGHLSRVAFDVYSAEPPGPGNPLLAPDLSDRVVLTPHLGANTEEAQSAVARIAAENLLAALRGEPYEHAVNLPFVEQRMSGGRRAFLDLARRIGILGANLAPRAAKAVRVIRRGPLFEEEESVSFELPYRLAPFTVSLLKGFLEVRQGPEVNLMVAPLLAAERGIRVEEGRGESGTYRNCLEAFFISEGEPVSIVGTVTEEGKMRIVDVNGYWIDFVPQGAVLLFSNFDRPGVIGRVGSLLGRAGVNIANFALGRKNGSGQALGALQIDSGVPPEIVEALRLDADLLWAVCLDFEAR